MGDLEKLAKLKKRVASLQRDADKASGALERVQSQLKEDFDCDTLEEGEKLLARLEKQARIASKNFRKALAVFEKKWP